jgi:phage internal scaffolding protein
MGEVMKPPFVRSPYNYDLAQASDLSGLICDDVSLTKQSFAEEADINTIVRLFGLTGKLPDDPVRAPTYGDFTGIGDYQSALNAVMEAEDSFMSMPADIRSRFHNDAGAFVDFCSNPANLDEMVKMGLAVAAPTAKVDPVKVDPEGSPKGNLDGAAALKT